MKTNALVGLALLLSAQALGHTAPLAQVLDRVAHDRDSGLSAWVVLDLDETLVDSGLRRYLSYRDALNRLCESNRDGDCGRVAGINFLESANLKNHYDWTPLFERVGVKDSPWRQNLLSQGLQIYLSGLWIEMDQAIPGAVEFVQDLRARGAELYFVSSRWQKAQGEATLRSLIQLGMATQADADHIVLRPDGMTSIDFKKGAFARIAQTAAAQGADIAGAFENEPANMNAMSEIFPGALHVFVLGATEHEGTIQDNVAVIRNFRSGR